MQIHLLHLNLDDFFPIKTHELFSEKSTIMKLIPDPELHQNVMSSSLTHTKSLHQVSLC